VLAYLKSLFTRQTVDSIIADIEAKVDKLNVVAELHIREIAAHNAVIDEKTKLVALARTEFSRAKSIAGKLADLIHV
jgi:hypothetical protein